METGWMQNGKAKVAGLETAENLKTFSNERNRST